MIDLHPTKTRLALLQAVADGAVTEHYPILPANPYAQWDRGPGEVPRYRRVSSSVQELHRAGWIGYGAKLDDHYKAPRLLVVTDVGQAVLDAQS
jgi:hypothetical protein